MKEPLTFKPRTCPICGRQFMPHCGSHKYCTKECARRAKRERAVKRYRQHPKKYAASIRKWHYRHRYGCTLNDYNRLFRRQQGCCAVCGRHRSLFGQHLDVDHNHKTGKIRGLLCNGCNRYVGRVEKNLQWKTKKAILVKVYLDLYQ